MWAQVGLNYHLVLATDDLCGFVAGTVTPESQHEQRPPLAPPQAWTMKEFLCHLPKTLTCTHEPERKRTLPPLGHTSNDSNWCVGD